VSSIAAVQPRQDQIPYAAAKAGLNVLTVAMARSFGPTVRVNALAPGVIKTSFSRALYESDEAGTAARQPMGRLGTPDDVAAAALFLLSDASSWMTGEVVVVDGGGALTWPS